MLLDHARRILKLSSLYRNRYLLFYIFLELQRISDRITIFGYAAGITGVRHRHGGGGSPTFGFRTSFGGAG